ncbi:MAG: hypothetical protein HY308_02215 [Gammaproteobacteria bacterium]|nr:hypothetical protein [Gammaproteobacteria bacterium]
MATVMEVQTLDTRLARRSYFSAIRWGAILAGVVGGTASYLLLSLLGVAVGLTAIDPTSAEPIGRVPLGAGIWTGVSLLASAFIGGYVAGHMSGLSRSSDGMLHGFVSWAATTLLYAVLTTSAIGAILGGTFRVLTAGTQTAAQATSGNSQGALNQLSQMIGANGQVNPESLNAVRKAISSGNREQAIKVLVNDMGVAPDQAEQVVDRMTPLLSQQGARETAAKATDALTAASWWLFIGLLLSLVLGVSGGATGVRATGKRLAGDHIAERQTRVTSVG